LTIAAIGEVLKRVCVSDVEGPSRVSSKHKRKQKRPSSEDVQDDSTAWFGKLQVLRNKSEDIQTAMAAMAPTMALGAESG
jgi:hypothetical protein